MTLYCKCVMFLYICSLDNFAKGNNYLLLTLPNQKST